MAHVLDDVGVAVIVMAETPLKGEVKPTEVGMTICGVAKTANVRPAKISTAAKIVCQRLTDVTRKD